LGLLRQDKLVEASATLIATSRPLKVGGQRVYLGVELGEAKEGEGVRVERVTAGSPAASAGLQGGDYIRKVDGAELARSSRLTDLLSEKKPGDTLVFGVRRDGKDVEVKATLTAAEGGRGRRGGGGDGGGTIGLWKKDVFRLAVVLIEFSDIKHNAKVKAK